MVSHTQFNDKLRNYYTYVVGSTTILSVCNNTVTVLTSLAKVVLLEITALFIKTVSIEKIVNLKVSV